MLSNSSLTLLSTKVPRKHSFVRNIQVRTEKERRIKRKRIRLNHTLMKALGSLPLQFSQIVGWRNLADNLREWWVK